jgi:hypothetical protein
MLGMVLLTVLFVGTGVAAALAAPMSFMAFDSGVTTLGWCFVGAMFAYPVLVLGSQVAAWWMFLGQWGAPFLTCLIPLASPVFLGVAWLVLRKPAE